MVVRGLLSITFLFGIGVINAGPLTRAENEERSGTCGGLILPTPGDNIEENSQYKGTANDTWLLTIRPKTNSNITFPLTTAFLISPRHILTSAQVVLGDDKKYRFNGQDVDNCCSVLERGHGSSVDVPIEALNTFDIWDPVKPLGVKIVKGRFFYLCFRNKREMYVPLLMEISPSTKRKFPCFVDEKFAASDPAGVVIDFYGIAWGKTMKHHKAKVTSQNAIWYLSEIFKEGGSDRGGPLVIVNGNKSVVVGLKESDPQTYNDNGLYSFKLGPIEKEICEFSGVCWNYTLPEPTTTTKASRGRKTKRRPDPNSLTTLNPDEDEDVIGLIPESDEELDDDDPNTSDHKLELLGFMIIFGFYWM